MAARMPRQATDPLADPRLVTRAEATKYAETSLHSHVVAFCDALAEKSPLVHRTSLGRSGEGQDIAALIISDRKCFSPEAAKKQKKPIVMIEANIHAGEVEGKEASLALVRDLVFTKLGKGILNKVCIVLIPDFNPDGNDRISPKNRALNLADLEGQVNPPGGVGMRYTGEGWNLNRDNMKQEAPETRHLAAFLQRYWPHLFIDCHTTDGSLHTYDLTFDCPRGNDALFAPVRAYNRELLLKVSKEVERKHGFSSQWYGNFVQEPDPESGWHTYPALPRFGSHYRGLLGRLDVLLETYSYISYEKRCATTRAWLLELLRYAAKNAYALRTVVEDQEAKTIAQGRAPDPRTQVGIAHGVAKRDGSGALHFDYPAHAVDGDFVTLKSFDRESLKARKYPGKKRVSYKSPHMRTFIPTTSVRLPAAYLVPASLAERLRGHGISFTELKTETPFQVEAYTVVAKEDTFSPDVAASVPPKGEAEVPLSQKPPPTRFETVLTVRAEQASITAPKGTLLVPTAQRAGVLAVYLLEPCADDGLTRWKFLDAHIKVNHHFPIYRLLSHVTPRTKPE
jgi:hypothetical protein